MKDRAKAEKMILRNILEKEDMRRMLDIGTGQGYFLSTILDYLCEKSTVVSSDISVKMLEGIKGRLDHRCLLIAMDAMNISLKVDSLDLITANQVIEHVEDDLGMLKECHRVLRNNAHVYLSTVLKDSKTFYIYRRNKDSVLHPDHLREYSSASELRDKLSSAGFEIISEKVTPMKWPLFGLCIRLLKRLRIIDPVELVWSIKKNAILGKLYAILLIRIPGYHKLEFLARKR